MKTPSVAIIDVGSNTIKLLVAARGKEGEVTVLHQASEPTRMWSGAGFDHPALTESNCLAGIATITKLLNEAKLHQPCQIRIVATGAVRDAANGQDFAKQVGRSTGHSLSILSGDEEATGIAAGLLTDPELERQKDFLACDLGGGSLELILIVDRSVQDKISLPLGAVRLTKRFVTAPHEPVPSAEREAIEQYVGKTFAGSGFPFPTEKFVVVGTGGSFATVRGILAERESISFDQRARLKRDDFSKLLAETVALSLEERHQRFPGLPANRADIMSAALVCIIALLDHLNAVGVRNSLRNLRYGIAAELLAKIG